MGSSDNDIKAHMQAHFPSDKKWLNATYLSILKRMVIVGNLVKTKKAYQLSPQEAAQAKTAWAEVEQAEMKKAEEAAQAEEAKRAEAEQANAAARVETEQVEAAAQVDIE